jgi:hypothetical protein
MTPEEALSRPTADKHNPRQKKPAAMPKAGP